MLDRLSSLIDSESVWITLSQDLITCQTNLPSLRLQQSQLRHHNPRLLLALRPLLPLETLVPGTINAHVHPSEVGRCRSLSRMLLPLKLPEPSFMHRMPMTTKSAKPVTPTKPKVIPIVQDPRPAIPAPTGNPGTREDTHRRTR